MKPSQVTLERLPRPIRSERAFIRAAKKYATVDPRMLLVLDQVRRDPAALGFKTPEAPR